MIHTGHKELLNVFGFPVYTGTYNGVLKKIESAITNHQKLQIVTTAAETLVRAVKIPEFGQLLKHSTLNTADGAGVVWAVKKLHNKDISRITGVDLTEKIIQSSINHQWRIFLFGAAPDVIELAMSKIKEAYPGVNIVGYHHGFVDSANEDAIVEYINQANPEILIVAMGAPRQDLWINKNLPRLNCFVGMGVGGAIDVMSGHVKRAPDVVQKYRLEWLYRLMQSPKKWKRAWTLPYFVFYIMKYGVKPVL